MNLFETIGTAAGEIGLLALFAAGATATPATPEAITVQVFNEAGASQNVIDRAERNAAWIFGRAGISVKWVNCPSYSRDRGPHQVCVGSNDPTLFVLSIASECPPEQHDTALGFALLAGRANHAAAVYPRIAAFAALEPEYREADLLGCVIAHELGHLLFHSSHHGCGIMKSNWSRDECLAMTQRGLAFTPDQARTLRASLAARRERDRLNTSG